MRAHRQVVREFVLQERVSVLCLVETKIDVLSSAMAADLMGTSFDYALLPSIGTSGGVLVAWCRDDWSCVSQRVDLFSVTG